MALSDPGLARRAEHDVHGGGVAAHAVKIRSIAEEGLHRLLRGARTSAEAMFKDGMPEG